MSTETLTNLKNEIIELFENALEGHGQNKKVGTIYANLVASQDPLTQDQLAEKLQTSNSTISRSLTSLEERFRLIKSKRLQGTKKAEYSVSENTFDTFFTIGIFEIFQQYQRISNRVKSIKSKFEVETKEQNKNKENKFYSDLIDELDNSISFYVEKLSDLTTILQERTF